MQTSYTLNPSISKDICVVGECEEFDQWSAENIDPNERNPTPDRDNNEDSVIPDSPDNGGSGPTTDGNMIADGSASSRSPLACRPPRSDQRCHASLSTVMPFLEDSTWPAGLLANFERASTKRAPFEKSYYGPYDKLLNYCFGESFTFYVAPQCPPRDDNRDALDFIIYLVVFDAEDRPVLLAEIKDGSWAKKALTRSRADEQMRNRYNMMLEDCPLPRLWGLSLLGTKMRVYCGNKASFELHPGVEPRPDRSKPILPPDFLAGEWNIDILSQEGFEKMKEVVNDIVTSTPNAE